MPEDDLGAQPLVRASVLPARYYTGTASAELDRQREDVAICEQVQRGLASGSYHAGRLNPRRESGVHHFHELLRASYRAAAGGRLTAK